MYLFPFVVQQIIPHTLCHSPFFSPVLGQWYDYSQQGNPASNAATEPAVVAGAQ